MGVVDDILDLASRRAQDRTWWAQTWYDIARLVLPTEAPVTALNALTMGVPGSQGRAPFTSPNSTSTVKQIYDNTGMWAVDRLAAGMESLITPQSEKWHGLGIEDVTAGDPTEEQKIYLDKLRNVQFSLRYDPRAGFISAHQKAMRSCVALGTGVIYIEQGDGRARPGDPDTVFRYKYCPLPQCLLGTNDNGVVDSNFRYPSFNVKQLVQKFGRDKVSAKVQALYDKGQIDENIQVLHAVMPRPESGSSFLSGSIRGSRIGSYWIEVDQRHLLNDSGFFEFPYAVYHWMQTDNSAYAESPVMLALSEIKSLQVMGKSELRAFAQWVDPPLGTVNDGVMNRPNLNPRAINPGAVGPDGSLRVKPLITAQNPDFAEKVMETRRNGVRETLYINLFQILIKNPQMTATEAMLRANEKGELLGPAGGKIQGALAVMADRELGILERKGIFSPQSQLAPPESLRDKSVGIKFTSPLDRMRRANEAIGIQKMLEVLLPLAKAKPSVLDKLDEDNIVNNLREILGAPANTLVAEPILKQRRAATEQKGGMADNLMAGQGMADIAKSASIAGRNAGETSLQAPQIMSALSEILDRLKSGAESGNAPPQSVDGVNALMAQFGKPPAQSPSGLAGLPV